MLSRHTRIGVSQYPHEKLLNAGVQEDLVQATQCEPVGERGVAFKVEVGQLVCARADTERERLKCVCERRS